MCVYVYRMCDVCETRPCCARIYWLRGRHLGSSEATAPIHAFRTAHSRGYVKLLRLYNDIGVVFAPFIFSTARTHTLDALKMGGGGQ